MFNIKKRRMGNVFNIKKMRIGTKINIKKTRIGSMFNTRSVPDTRSIKIKAKRQLLLTY